MKTKIYVERCEKETNQIINEIDKVIEKYLETSEMPIAQKIVNAGRALNGYHVGWVGNLCGMLDTKIEKMKTEKGLE